MISASVLEEFHNHATRLNRASRLRREAVSFKNLVLDREERQAVSVAETLGRRQPQDVFLGDVNLRTLRTLLSMIDERGWERSAHQLLFHQSFEKCVSRVLYKEGDEWRTQKPRIMKHNNWAKCSSEVMIRSAPLRPSLGHGL
jgi:hypothetical protein